MQQQPGLMSLHDGVRSIELENEGRFEEARRVHRQIPMPPYLAKFLKDHLGSEALVQTGWNLAEAEAEYGTDWLSG